MRGSICIFWANLTPFSLQGVLSREQFHAGLRSLPEPAFTPPRNADPQGLFSGPKKYSLWRFPMGNISRARITLMGFGIARAGPHGRRVRCALGKRGKAMTSVGR
jgi:hypothetical protein